MKKLRFLALFLVLTAFAFPAKDVKLQYKFKVGDQFTLDQTTHQAIKQTIPGSGVMNVDVDVTATTNLKVVELTTTGARIEITYEKMKLSTKSPMGSMDMDSEGSPENVQNKTIKAMMNKPYFFKISKTGVVENVEGTESLTSEFASLGLDDATLKALKQQFEQMLNNDSQKASLAAAFVTYPENKLKAGDSWKNTAVSQIMNFATKVDNTLTLKSFDATKGVITLDGVIATTDKDKVSALPNGIKSKLDISGKQASTVNIDIKTGWSVDMKTVSEIKGMMTLLAGGMIPSDMEVPMEIVTNTDFKLTKK
jgi:hypothetical protein